MLLENIIKKVLSRRDIIKRVELSSDLWVQFCVLLKQKTFPPITLSELKKRELGIAGVPVKLNTKIKFYRILKKG